MKIIKNHSHAFLSLPTIVFLFGMSWLAGCAQPASEPRTAALTSEQRTSESSAEQQKKLAVVSVLGDVFHASSIGASIFSKQRYHSRIPEWAVDEYAEAIITDIVRRRDQYELIEFSPRRESFAKVYKPVSRWKPQARNYDLQKIAPLLTALHKKYGVDTLLLMLNNEVKDPTDKGSNLTLFGYGLYHNDWFGVDTFTHLFARMLVVDTRNASLMAAVDLADFTEVNNQLWHDGLKQTPPQDRESLRQETRVLIKRNVIKALVETNFASLDELRTAKQKVLAGSTYKEAVRDLYRIFNMRRVFASYTRAFVEQQLPYNTGSEIYADVYRRWMNTYFRQTQAIEVLHRLYRAQDYSLNELKSIAVLAKNQRTRGQINRQRIIDSVTRQAWEQLATPSRLNGLLQAVQQRRALIQQEVSRSRAQPQRA